MLEHHIPHLLPARQNFNWYQSRHPVLFLGEIHGRYFLALWTRKKKMCLLLRYCSCGCMLKLRGNICFDIEEECFMRLNMSNSTVVYVLRGSLFFSWCLKPQKISM
ncbi:hypothetical protein QL285_029674 [Trifolium repens]|nr:hypothetical protein QL285_029674 [Trifolium repens]